MLEGFGFGRGGGDGEPMVMFESRDILCVHPRRGFSPPWELQEIHEGRGQTVRVNQEI